MEPVPFRLLPLIVQITSLATIFLGWVIFAETIIDRHGLDRFLPLYRVGNFCIYDAAIAAALVAGWFALRR